MLRRSIQIGLSLLGLYVVLSIVAGIYLAEAAIHPHRRPVTGRARYMAMVETYSNSGGEDVAVDTTYQVKLKGWYVQPKDWNHEAVILLHGVSDDLEGVAGYSVMFLKAGYAVLLPDSRAHGESGGAIASYGVMERYDVAAWAVWLHQRMHGCTYLFGEIDGRRHRATGHDGESRNMRCRGGISVLDLSRDCTGSGCPGYRHRTVIHAYCWRSYAGSGAFVCAAALWR
jgi:hypothetical protein